MLARRVLLEGLLRGCVPVSNWPAELDAFRGARVLACLSGVVFPPDVQAAALAAGVVPVVGQGGARFHVPPEAAALLPPAS